MNAAIIVGCAATVAGCSAAPKVYDPGVSVRKRVVQLPAKECRRYNRPRHASTQWDEFEASSEVKVPSHVVEAIMRASKVTGIDADYLALTAARESNFRTRVKAQTSSAQGMFQFVKQTWLRTLAKYGRCHGLGRLASHIEVRPDGRHFVRSKYVRRKILNLRNNPTVASIMAGRLTQGNAEIFEKMVGYSPSQGELYISHFLGVTNAAKLARAARRQPTLRADRQFRAAARANPSIFYVNRRPRSVRQVFSTLVKKHARVRVIYPNGRRKSRPLLTSVGRTPQARKSRGWWQQLKRWYS